jgi:hypothetical protein
MSVTPQPLRCWFTWSFGRRTLLVRREHHLCGFWKSGGLGGRLAAPRARPGANSRRPRMMPVLVTGIYSIAYRTKPRRGCRATGLRPCKLSLPSGARLARAWHDEAYGSVQCPAQHYFGTSEGCDKYVDAPAMPVLNRLVIRTHRGGAKETGSGR